jgi:hypothetical protein
MQQKKQKKSKPGPKPKPKEQSKQQRNRTLRGRGATALEVRRELHLRSALPAAATAATAKRLSRRRKKSTLQMNATNAAKKPRRVCAGREMSPLVSRYVEAQWPSQSESIIRALAELEFLTPAHVWKKILMSVSADECGTLKAKDVARLRRHIGEGTARLVVMRLKERVQSTCVAADCEQPVYCAKKETGKTFCSASCKGKPVWS